MSTPVKNVAPSASPQKSRAALNRGARELPRALLELLESERSDLARELHAHLGQQLTGAVLVLNLLQKNSRKQKLPEGASIERLSDLLTEARRQLREVMVNLQPVGESPDGLALALGEFLRQAGGRFGVDCQLEYPREVSIKSPLTANTLLRVGEQITLGTLANLQLEKVVLLLSRKKENLFLDISSFGRKSTPRGELAESKAITTAGLRVAALGGTLSVRKLAFRGTRVRCLVPDKVHPPVLSDDLLAQNPSNFAGE